MAVNPFDYSKKTFLQIYNELKTLWPSKPDWFMTLMAGRADVLHWYLDARANNLYIDSAYTREAILQLCKLINYELSPASAASVTVTFNLKAGTTLPKTINKNQLICSTTGSIEILPVRFEATDSQVFTTLSKDIECVQGETIADEFLGRADGSEFQELDLQNTNFLKNSSAMTIGAETWTEIESFLDYTSIDKVYKVYSRDDNSAFVRFGDGVTGQLPPLSTDIFLTYRIGGGTLGNVAVDEINVYLGDDTDIESVNNALPATGGAEKESIERARRLAPLSLAAQNRAIKTSDIKALSEGFPGVARAGILSNYYGFFSAQVQVIPFGGGYPSSLLKSDLQAYLIDRTPVESIDIRCVDPDYVVKSVTAEAKLLSGYTFSIIENYIKLAFDLILSEKTQEIKDVFESEGMSQTIERINSLFDFTFTPDDSIQINKILDNISVRDWGEGINRSDLFAIDAYIDGLLYVNILIPATNESIDYNQIITEGTHTVLEI